ncbi:MAG: hypothetical protein ACYTEI_01375, partial [Planctomycetota bacterium]
DESPAIRCACAVGHMVAQDRASPGTLHRFSSVASFHLRRSIRIRVGTAARRGIPPVAGAA